MTGLVITHDKYSYSDLHKNEYRDCTVTAVATAFNLHYNEAHDFMSQWCERKNRRGVYFKTAFEGSHLWYKTTEIPYKGSRWDGDYNKENNITVGQFLEQNPTGTFIVLVRGHAFAIKDGVVYDHYLKLKRHIIRVYRVEE